MQTFTKFFLFFLFFIFLNFNICYAEIIFVDGKWETTLDCSEWTGPQSSGDIGCNITRWGNYDAGGKWDQITSAANYDGPGAGGGRGLRQWVVGDNVTNPSPSTLGKLIEFGTAAQYNLWIRFYIRFESGLYFFPTDETGNKLLYFKTTGYANLHFLTLGQNLQITDGSHYTIVPDVWANYFGDGSANDVSDGSWHCVEIQIKSETVTKAPFDGEWRVWIDGDLVLEAVDKNLGIFSTGRPLIGVSPQHNWHTLPNIGAKYTDMDEIVIYNTTPPNKDAQGNPYIGPLSGEIKVNTTPPPAPTNLREKPPQ